MTEVAILVKNRTKKTKPLYSSFVNEDVGGIKC